MFRGALNAPLPTMNQCKDCKIWKDIDERPIGTCRFHAPEPLRHGLSSSAHEDRFTFWPVVNEDDFCGQFAAKEVVKAAEPLKVQLQQKAPEVPVKPAPVATPKRTSRAPKKKPTLDS